MVAAAINQEQRSNTNDLSTFTDDVIEALLRKRYANYDQYTGVGYNATVSLNLYGDGDEDALEDGSLQAPNMATFAHRAWEHLKRERKDQSVIFLGESGSGKTFSRSRFTRALLEESTDSELLGREISIANFILSAFSCAKTVTSNNASRCGLYTEVQYDRNSKAVGAKYLDYRLEKDRISRFCPGERNFHALYWLLAGTSPAEKDHLALDPDVRYRFLGHPRMRSISGMDDCDKFLQLKVALNKIGFSRVDIAQIFQILAAIIHIGQLEFEDKPAVDHAIVKNRDSLAVICAFLGVKESTLEVTLAHKTQWVKKERLTQMLNAKGARQHADDLAKTIYSLLFSYIVETINVKLCRDDVQENFIGIVDFPGIQFSGCRFEELLVNIANEALVDCLTTKLIKVPQKDHTEEDIDFPQVVYNDNSDSLALLLRRQNGLLSIVDSQSNNPDKSDMTLCESLRKRFESGSLVSSHPHWLNFTVRHYTGDIEYDAIGLLEENRSIISGDLMTVFRGEDIHESGLHSTNNLFVASLFRSSAVTYTSHPNSQHTITQAKLPAQPLRQPSLSHKQANYSRQNSKTLGTAGQFASALNALRETILQTQSRFVLCIKPNDRRLPKRFDSGCVRPQLESLYIRAIAELTSKMEHTVTMSLHEFAARYAPDELDPEDELSSWHDYVARKGFDIKDVAVGKEKVFLSEKAWESIEIAREQSYTAAYDTGDQTFDSSQTQGLETDFADYYETETENVSQSNLLPADQFYENGLRTQRVPSVMPRELPHNRFSVTPSINASDVFHGYDSKSTMIKMSQMEEGYGAEATDEVIKSASRKRWMFIVWAITWYIPSFVLRLIGRMKRKDIQVAWREKLAINLIIWFMCAIAIFMIIFFGGLICPRVNIFTVDDISKQSYTNKPGYTLASIRGQVFDLSSFAPNHYPFIVPSNRILSYGGGDISDLFPVQVSALCDGVDGNVDPGIVLGTNTGPRAQIAKFHDFREFTNDSRPDWFFENIRMMMRTYYFAGDVGYTSQKVKDFSYSSKHVAIINDSVYDLSDYIIGNRMVMPLPGHDKPAPIPPAFMSNEVVDLFALKSGQDISEDYMKLNMDPELRKRMDRCLRNLFYIGVVDHRSSFRCLFARYFLLAISIMLATVIVAKFLAALQLGTVREPEKLRKFIICFIPCYTEGEEEIQRAIDSLVRMHYDDTRKLLFIVCDGTVKGAGNDRSTPQIVLDVLQHDDAIDAEPCSFESVGEGMKQHNVGKVYSGLYSFSGHTVPYIVVVKVGKPSEIVKPGNRGKRDSQILLMRFLNRIHYNRPLNPLELELYHQLRNVIGVMPTFYEYVLMIDCDTAVAPNAATSMIASFVHDNRIIGLCGETSLSNPNASFVTMIQVYEYWISHNLSKAFESMFSSVSCLPGCFTMYRVFHGNTGKPLFVNDPILNGYAENRVDYLHTKNLLALGEDRFLTTLLLKHFPRYKTKFNREAEAYTSAPVTFYEFASQRRRWINSTVHNLVELLSVSQLCGFCCFSMRFVVLVDIMSTIIQPVFIVYIFYLIYLAITQTGMVPLTSIVILLSIYGLQAIIFILRRRWEMIVWMIIYILALPIFYLILPLAAFWRMDNFSWGATRLTQGEHGKILVYSDEGKFDPQSIPRVRWEDYAHEPPDHSMPKPRTSSIFSDSSSYRSKRQEQHELYPRPGSGLIHDRFSSQSPPPTRWRG